MPDLAHTCTLRVLPGLMEKRRYMESNPRDTLTSFTVLLREVFQSVKSLVIFVSHSDLAMVPRKATTMSRK